MLTIVSDDGERRAVVREGDDGCSVEYTRRGINDARGIAPGTERGYVWRKPRVAFVPQPFHVALNIAHDIVNAN